MTIINGIKINIPKIKNDETKSVIINNIPIDSVLHVITVLSNPCQYARRFILAREFIQRIEKEENIQLYVVELAYGTQKFYVTDTKNKRHLQLHGDIPLWHKENMVNIGVKKLLPASWKAMAWIDADVEFENTTWALDTLKVLNGYKDVIQLFSHCVDMDKHKQAMSIFPSFGFQFCKQNPYGGIGINMWHPGYAWACSRTAYDKMGGIYEESILGSGDNNMAFSFIQHGITSLNKNASDNYKKSVQEFENRSKNLRLGYIPGVIRHYFHGSKKNRRYMDRWKILVNNQYCPSLHITKNKDGLIIPTKNCPKQILIDIMKYFSERNEDEGFRE